MKPTKQFNLKTWDYSKEVDHLEKLQADDYQPYIEGGL